MDGVAKPDLIVDGYSSPHNFALKPSHAKMLQDADLIFWVGEDLENFLEKPLNSIAKKAKKIELMEIKGLTKLKFRERNVFEEHDHGHKEDGHDDHAKKEDDHDDHDHGDGLDPSLPPTDGDHEHHDPETYDEAVTELLATQKAIAEAFAAGNQDDAHGPLHNVGHLLGNTETLIEKSDMDDDTKKKLSEAIEQLFASYGAVDDKMHNSEKGKDYSDVSEQIENAISELKAQVNISKE